MLELHRCSGNVKAVNTCLRKIKLQVELGVKNISNFIKNSTVCCAYKTNCSEIKVYRRRVQLCDLFRVWLSPNDSWDKLHPLCDLELDKRLKRWTDGWFVTFVTTQQRHEDTLWDVLVKLECLWTVSQWPSQSICNKLFGANNILNLTLTQLYNTLI